MQSHIFIIQQGRLPQRGRSYRSQASTPDLPRLRCEARLNKHKALCHSLPWTHALITWLERKHGMRKWANQQEPTWLPEKKYSVIYTYMYVCMSLCLYVGMSLCLCVSMSVCRHVWLAVCLSVCLAGWLSVCMYVRLYVSIYLSTYLSIYIYI